MANPIPKKADTALKEIKLPFFPIYHLVKQGNELKKHDIVLLDKTSIVPPGEFWGDIDRIEYYVCLTISHIRREKKTVIVKGTERHILSVHSIKFQYESFDFINTYKPITNDDQTKMFKANQAISCLLHRENLLKHLKSLKDETMDDSEFLPC